MSTLAGLDAPFDASFSTSGSSSSSTVPGKWEVALNGHGYRIDHAVDQTGLRGLYFDRRSTPVLRNQADTGSTPGEQSINREDLWRRAQESWHHGAGQNFLDRTDSDAARFRISKGVNVWDKWSLTLLPDTTQQRVSANTNLRLTSAGTYTYLADGNDLLFTNDLSALPVVWTTVTGTPASPLLWVTSDGFTIYAAYATGVYTTTRGAAGAVAYNGQATTLLTYLKGRLMAANANSVYNITSGAAPTALLTHANTDFTWVGFADGPAYIYMAGFSGNRSLIYKTTITPDGTALGAPTVAGELPTGEIVRTVKGYLGVVAVGLDTGVRVASVNSDGNLTFGPLIPTTSAVRNFDPGGRFIWYGLSNYDATSTGLGRLDLSAFTESLTPAYASDLMATAQGDVLSISTSQGRRIFVVSGVGVFVESTSKVASGTLSTGRIAYGIGDDKVAMFLDLRSAALVGKIAVALAHDDGTPTSIGSHTETGLTRPSYPLNAAQARGEFFELTFTLNRAVDVTTGPTVTRYTLRAYPAPTRSFTFTVPLLFAQDLRDMNDQPNSMDIAAERAFLEALCRSQELITYQEGTSSYTVLLDDFIWVPVKQTTNQSNYDGTFVCQLKEVSS